MGLLILTGLALLPTSRARERFETARAEMLEGRTELLEGDALGAERSFEQAAEAFIQAGDQARNPLLRVAGLLPLIGRTPDAVVAMADAGRDVARAGIEVTGAVGRLPGGLEALAPSGGRIPGEPLEALAPALGRAAVLVTAAEERLDEAPDSFLAGPVATARRDFDEQLGGLGARIQAAATIVEELPAFLGYEGSRRYFFGASNPAEARGTGGLIGAYAILTAEEGFLSFSTFQPIQSLPDIPAEEVEPPNPDYARRYPGAWTFWQNINLTPDFPSVGHAISNLYQHVQGEHLDGVITADPFALEALMGVTGPVDVPALDRTVAADEVVRVTTNEAYSTLTDPAGRKEILGEVAKRVVEQFLSGGTGVRGAAKSLVDAAGGGHLRIFSTDPEMQAALQSVEAGGALTGSEGDYLSIVYNNNAGTKVDFYAHPSIQYDVHLGAAGTARGEVSITVDNEAPASGLPANVIGPFPGASEAGENVSSVTAFLSPGTVFEGAQQDGAPVLVHEDRELGHPVVQAGVRIPSGGTTTLSYRMATRHAWTGSGGRGVYRLALQSPPTINPVRLTLDIQAPAGTDILWTNVPMEVTGNRARWSGVAEPRQVFEVRFQKPLIPRLWQGVVDFFDRPLVTLD